MIEKDLVDYIRSEIAYDRSEPLTPEEPLLDGALDSVDILKLVSFVEERYSVTINDDELVPENFATVTTLVELLRKKGVT